ncbi:hypothetical protein [Singulisphaera acidiphila]|uniref:Uncharacterized protein n=1 Tax=Singulisphaera acidiphila (strain ATCC BAA-1392 / DSM 18658 / VKM B-2454 / MOB10) TaxID=886293 RepID=L0DTH1_SINAD|nr:hypothetical protein [Singulisphaera acidiphila]AGA31671.1 hypothetical protein Sinac_7641 [Singulisphaera acidiphila DSM 18658]
MTTASATLAGTGELFTVEDIAGQTGEQSYRIAYLIRTRKIKHVGQLGSYRLFDAAGVEAIKTALAQRGKGRPARQFNAVVN